MANELANTFYGSQAWKDCRAAYKRKAKGLCERCLAKGLFVPGQVVHHKEYITLENITDPQILTDFNNLELLCRDCHEKEHDRRKKRYKFDELGHVII